LLFRLPTEAEWEKAARGPDSFDYGLSMSISDAEVPLYNWKKNPDAAVTVVGIRDSLIKYAPNRYGLYHMSGNVVEWTQSIFVPLQQRPSIRRRGPESRPGTRPAGGPRRIVVQRERCSPLHPLPRRVSARGCQSRSGIQDCSPATASATWCGGCFSLQGADGSRV
jgi:toxoflavin biosynthesis protein ToxD